MKLFLFLIGGTGSRVMKALTILMSAGVKLEGVDAVIPIIIDPDSANGDLNRTVQLIKTYKDIRQKAFAADTSFFHQKISSLDELGDGGFVSDNFIFDIDGVKEEQFKDFIGFSSMDRSNQAMLSALFSKSNLDADMDIGFNGNPNIGSVVLNKFRNTSFFEKFAANFTEGDRIFIVSSIFGGTGAAGFPLMVKNIRNAQPPIPNHFILQNAQVGAVTLLPYFSIQKKESVYNDSATFFAKTKAALSYYARNLTGNNSLNALYYIGDRIVNEQPGADGAASQRNRAHFVELAAALAIEDFAGATPQNLQTRNGKALNPRYFEFGLEKASDSITFEDLAAETFRIAAKPLIQFGLFNSFYRYEYPEFSRLNSEAWANDGKNKLHPDHLNSRFLSQLSIFTGFFTEWLDEMSASSVSFSPIDNTRRGADILNIIKGIPERATTIQSWMGKTGLNHYRGLLSQYSKLHDHLPAEQKLLSLFSEITEKLTRENLNIQA